MSDNDNSESSLTYQQETAQDMLCLCAIVLVVGAILIVAYFQDTEKKILKAIIGGVLIVLGAIPCLILCVCLQKMSDEEAEMNQFEAMCQLRAMESINRLDGTISISRFDSRRTLSRLESVDQDEPLPVDSVRPNAVISAPTPTLIVPSITLTIIPSEETEQEVANPQQFLAVDGQGTDQTPPRRGSLFESVAEVMEASIDFRLRMEMPNENAAINSDRGKSRLSKSLLALICAIAIGVILVIVFRSDKMPFGRSLNRHPPQLIGLVLIVLATFGLMVLCVRCLVLNSSPTLTTGTSTSYTFTTYGGSPNTTQSTWQAVYLSQVGAPTISGAPVTSNPPGTYNQYASGTLPQTPPPEFELPPSYAEATKDISRDVIK